MACTCSSVQTYALTCDSRVGGIKSVGIKVHGTSGSYLPVEVLPESSFYSSVMTYDKAKNLKYWTTDVTLVIGPGLTPDESGTPTVYGTASFVDALACPLGIDIQIITNGTTGASGTSYTIVLEEAYVQTGTLSVGAAKTDGGDGTIVFQVISGDKPTVSHTTA